MNNQSFKTWALDTGEKAAATLIEAAIVYAVAATQVDSAFWKGLLVACVIAVVNVLKAAMTFWMPHPPSFYLDLLVRALWTFVISVLGSLASVVWFDLIDLNFWQGAATAGLVSALSVAKAFLARPRTNTITPASLLKHPSAA